MSAMTKVSWSLLVYDGIAFLAILILMIFVIARNAASKPLTPRWSRLVVSAFKVQICLFGTGVLLTTVYSLIYKIFGWS